MYETWISLTGNLVDRPEERTTAAGDTFATFRVATNTRKRRPDGSFVDGETSYYRVTAWRALARNVLESFEPGQPVIVSGKQVVRSYQRNDGVWATSVDIEAVHAGHDLVRGTSTWTKVYRDLAHRSTTGQQGDGSQIDGDSARADEQADDDAARAGGMASDAEHGYVEVDPQTGEVRDATGEVATDPAADAAVERIPA